MTLIERINNVTKLWEMILPYIPTPQAVWVSRWCAYPDSAIERGIVRASKKFSSGITESGSIHPEQVYQYVCGVARNEAQGRNRPRARTWGG